ncbi:MAG: hypothetical protein Q9190_007316 [Brigantiaea leucoxantha]
MSAFSPYTDSPTSPAPFKSPNRSSNSSDNANFLQPPGASSPLASSLSDIADPSPVAPSSNGTDFEDTIIEPEEVEHLETVREEPRRESDSRPSLKQGERELKLDTKNAIANNLRPSSDEDEQPNSVIHAPQGFETFHNRRSPPNVRRPTPTPSQWSDIPTIQPSIAEETEQESPTPISTTVPPARDWSATPRAQTRSEAEIEALEIDRSQSRASNLEGRLLFAEPSEKRNDDQRLQIFLKPRMVNQSRIQVKINTLPYSTTPLKD